MIKINSIQLDLLLQIISKYKTFIDKKIVYQLTQKLNEHLKEYRFIKEELIGLLFLINNEIKYIETNIYELIRRNRKGTNDSFINSLKNNLKELNVLQSEIIENKK